MKKGIAMLLIAVLCLAMCGCGRVLDPEWWQKKDNMKLILDPKENGSDYYFEYQGANYVYLPDSEMFRPSTVGSYEEEDKLIKKLTLISWHFCVFPYPPTHYYSYSEDSPDYILSPKGPNFVWFKESFDYTSEIFAVDGTDIEIVLSEAFTYVNVDSPPSEKSISMYCKKYPDLRLRHIELFQVGDEYYAWMNITGTTYRISEKFLQMLIENGILE